MPLPPIEPTPKAPPVEGRDASLPPHWVTVVVTVGVLSSLVDFSSHFLEPLVSNELRSTWWNLGNTLLLALLTLALWALAAWRRRLGWILAAVGLTLATLLWVWYTARRWGTLFVMTPGLFALHVAIVGAIVLVAIGLLLVRSDAGHGLTLSTVIFLLLETLTVNLLVLVGTAFKELGAVSPGDWWAFASLFFVLNRSVDALPAMVLAGLLWSALHSGALQTGNQGAAPQTSPRYPGGAPGVSQCYPGRAPGVSQHHPGGALRTIGMAGGLVLAASLCQQLLHAHNQLVRPWPTPSAAAQALAVAIHVAGAGLLCAGLMALRRLGWPCLGMVAAATVGAVSGLVPLGRFLLGDPAAVGFSPLEAIPTGVLLIVVVGTRCEVPRATAWAVGLLLGLSIPLAALSTDGPTSLLHGMDEFSATRWAPGALMSVRSMVLVGAYGLFSLHLAQLLPRAEKPGTGTGAGPNTGAGPGPEQQG